MHRAHWTLQGSMGVRLNLQGFIIELSMGLVIYVNILIYFITLDRSWQGCHSIDCECATNSSELKFNWFELGLNGLNSHWIVIELILNSDWTELNCVWTLQAGWLEHVKGPSNSQEVPRNSDQTHIELRSDALEPILNYVMGTDWVQQGHNDFNMVQSGPPGIQI